MNRLFIVSGPSGSGKSSIAKSVISNEIISVTTRSPRQGEVHGKDYYFITEEEFDYLYRNNGLAEYTEYYGNAKYGITKEEIDTRLAVGDALVIVDIIGKHQLEKIYSNTVSVFVFVPDPNIVIKRMRLRGDSEENIAKRMKTYDEEVANFTEYDFLIDNSLDDFDRSVDSFRSIVGAKFD